MTSEHPLREIAELLRRIDERLARIEQEFTDPLLCFDKDGRLARPWWHDTDLG
jgi:hypothetical protein